MKRLLLFFITIGLNLTILAQDNSEQILIFRNSGEVNLLYTNLLDSIVCSRLDADSVLHDEMVSQIFYSKDSMLVVPLEEIDSVAFGSRNEMEYKEGVREITKAEDILWIVRYDGNSIFYRKDTPSDILPSQGMKLFYGLYDEDEQTTALFPYGLCVQVTSVVSLSDVIRVDVENVALEDVFSRLFFAGPVNKEVNLSRSIKRSPHNLNFTLPLGEMGSIQADGTIDIVGDAVINLFSHYYHVDLDLSMSYGFDVNATSKENTEINEEKIGESLTVATFYKVLNLKAAFGLFADISADLSLGLGMERTYNRHLSWTRKDGNNSFDFYTPSQNEPYKDEAKIDLTLDGNVHFGPLLRFDFATVGDVVGARANLKIGPDIEGKISMGMLRDMRTYNPELYGNAELRLRWKVGLEGFVTNRSSLISSDVVEHKFCSYSWKSDRGYKLQLFPNYIQTRGVSSGNATGTEISVSTKADNEIAHEVETGFEIVDESDVVVDSAYVDIVKAKSEEIQGFDTTFDKPGMTASEGRKYRVRPVFHYADYTISADYAHVRSDVNLQPVLFSGSNGAVTYVASYPYTGEVTKDETNYRAGAYLPIPVRDSVFQKEPSVITVLQFITDSQEDELIGTWMGMESLQRVTFVFEADGTGAFNNEPFNYTVNSPRTGEITLDYTNEGLPQDIISIIRLQEGVLQYRRRNNNNIYTLNKQL